MQYPRCPNIWLAIINRRICGKNSLMSCSVRKSHNSTDKFVSLISCIGLSNGQYWKKKFFIEEMYQMNIKLITFQICEQRLMDDIYINLTLFGSHIFPMPRQYMGNEQSTLLVNGSMYVSHYHKWAPWPHALQAHAPSPWFPSRRAVRKCPINSQS